MHAVTYRRPFMPVTGGTSARVHVLPLAHATCHSGTHLLSMFMPKMPATCNMRTAELSSEQLNLYQQTTNAWKRTAQTNTTFRRHDPGVSVDVAVHGDENGAAHRELHMAVHEML